MLCSHFTQFHLISCKKVCYCIIAQDARRGPATSPARILTRLYGIVTLLVYLSRWCECSHYMRCVAVLGLYPMFYSAGRKCAVQCDVWCAVWCSVVQWHYRARVIKPTPGRTHNTYLYRRNSPNKVPNSTQKTSITTQTQQNKNRSKLYQGFVWVLSPFHFCAGYCFSFLSLFFLLLLCFVCVLRCCV